MNNILYITTLLLFPINSFADKASVVWYTEQETDIEPETVRYIVTDRFMRSDNGDPKQGFVLLDRKQKKIFNVVPDSQSIMLIDGNGRIPVAPELFTIKEIKKVDPTAPKIDGKAVYEIQVSSAKQNCYNAMVAPGLHDEVRQAMLEFKQVLAVRQSRTLESTPEEMRSDCFMIQYLYAPALHLQHGLPVREWEPNGKSRQLVDFKFMPIDDSLFDLPPGFRQYSP